MLSLIPPACCEVQGKQHRAGLQRPLLQILAPTLTSWVTVSTSPSLGSFICEMRELGQVRSFFWRFKIQWCNESFPIELTGPPLINDLLSEKQWPLGIDNSRTFLWCLNIFCCVQSMMTQLESSPGIHQLGACILYLYACRYVVCNFMLLKVSYFSFKGPCCINMS